MHVYTGNAATFADARPRQAPPAPPTQLQAARHAWRSCSASLDAVRLEGAGPSPGAVAEVAAALGVAAEALRKAADLSTR